MRRNAILLARQVDAALLVLVGLATQSQRAESNLLALLLAQALGHVGVRELVVEILVELLAVAGLANRRDGGHGRTLAALLRASRLRTVIFERGRGVGGALGARAVSLKVIDQREASRRRCRDGHRLRQIQRRRRQRGRWWRWRFRGRRGDRRHQGRSARVGIVARGSIEGSMRRVRRARRLEHLRDRTSRGLGSLGGTGVIARVALMILLILLILLLLVWVLVLLLLLEWVALEHDVLMHERCRSDRDTERGAP